MATKGNFSVGMVAAVAVIIAAYALSGGGGTPGADGAGDPGSEQSNSEQLLSTTTAPEPAAATTPEPAPDDPQALPWQPSAVKGSQVVHHRAYTLSYNDRHEEADWVYYRLTPAMLEAPSSRNEAFEADRAVELETATSADYTNSGYTRGHLCPSADVRNDARAHNEVYLMANMAPQSKEFNAGVWAELESRVRYCAKKYETLYIATGPVLRDGLGKLKGDRASRRAHFNGVSIPEQFYKIIYTPSGGGQMAAYLLDHTVDREGRPWVEYNGYKESPYDLSDYAVSVDEVERLTGIDFFPGVAGEQRLEGQVRTHWFYAKQ